MVLIALASKKDAEALRCARIAAFEWELKTYGFVGRGYDSIENMLMLIKNEIVFKICLNKRIIGGICVVCKGDGLYLIGPLFIYPRFHNKGIGSYVMKRVESYLPDKKKIELNTAYLNFRNHHFYEKLGYKKIGEYPPNSKGFRLFLYEKNFD